MNDEICCQLGIARCNLEFSCVNLRNATDINEKFSNHLMASNEIWIQKHKGKVRTIFHSRICTLWLCVNNIRHI